MTNELLVQPFFFLIKKFWLRLAPLQVQGMSQNSMNNYRDTYR